jgi:hypothetical protein
VSAKVLERFIFVWSGQSFGLSNRLAIESVLRHHPWSTIEIHLEGPEPITLDFLLTRQLANVEIHNIDVAKLFHACDSDISKSSDLLAIWQRIPRTALSARSNLLRYALLHLRGGIYLDFDILVRRPLDDILKSSHSQVGAEFVWKLDEKRVQQGLTMQDWPMTSLWAVNWWLNKVFCTFSGQYSPPKKVQELVDRNVLVRALNNAVIASQSHSDLTTALLENAQKVDPTVRFSLGPSLLSTVVEQEPYLAHVHQPNAFFAVPPGQSYRFFIDERLQLPDESFLIHYVSSNHGELLNSLTPESIHSNRSQAVFWKMASSLLQSENFERRTRDAA